MLRAVGFIIEFNGYKNSRLVLADFFTVDEILTFKNSYLQPSGKPIKQIGKYAVGSFGDEDEVEGNADIVHFR